MLKTDEVKPVLQLWAPTEAESLLLGCAPLKAACVEISSKMTSMEG